MVSPVSRSWLVGLVLASGCLGHVQAPGGDGSEGGGKPPAGVSALSTDGVTSFSCDAKQQPAMDQLRALTNQQYLNTLNDLLVSAIGADATKTVMADSAVKSAVALIPPQQPAVPQSLPATSPAIPGTDAAITNATTLASTFPNGAWYRADQTLQQARVVAFFGVGTAVAHSLVTNSLGALVGSCALGTTGATDTACLTSFIQSFGARALRRAITADDVTAFTAYYELNGPDSTLSNPAAAAYEDLVGGILSAPEVLYFVEHGDTSTPVKGLAGVYALSSYELASRLSYQVWDTMPDDELWQKAVDGSILQDDVYAAEVKRLFADPRAATTLHEFFTDYFDTRSVGGPRGNGGLNYHDFSSAALLGNVIFKAFAGSDLPKDGNLFADMLAEAIGLADYYSWTKPGTLHDLLTSQKSFAQTSDVASLYKVAAWDGTSDPPDLPDAERPGLFTRALFVANGVDTAPILKGVFFRRTLLCDTLGAPPAAAAGAVVETTTTETTRDATSALTAAPGCAGCHHNLINPLGFASENFDGLGRLRTMETLFNSDGTVATMLPIDTTGAPWVWMADSTTQAAGIPDVLEIAESSGKPQACLARNYFRYTFARFEDTTVDACSLEPMRKALDSGTLADFWQSVVNTPAFKQRTFQ